MKHLIKLFTLSLILGCSSPQYSGTATDVNSGSLSGVVQFSGVLYKEDLEMTLYNGDGEIVQEKQISHGTYRFDLLEDGNYSLSASVGNRVVILGRENEIEVAGGAVQDIRVKRIVKHSFELRPSVGKSLQVTSFDLTNMKIDTLQENSYQLTFAEGEEGRDIRFTYSLDESDKNGEVELVKLDSAAYRMELTETTGLNLINHETVLLTGSGDGDGKVVIGGIIE